MYFIKGDLEKESMLLMANLLSHLTLEKKVRFPKYLSIRYG